MSWSNHDRAARARHMLEAYRSFTGDGPCSSDEDVIDALTDLRHYCDQQDLSFWNRDAIAHDHYLAELEDERRPGGAP